MKILQIVTQLEAGGAQKVSSWLQAKFSVLFPKDNNEVKFLFHRADFEGFTKLDCLRASRTKNPILLFLDLLKVCKKSRTFDVLIAHTHFSIVLCGFVKITQPRLRFIAVHHSEQSLYPRIIQVCINLLNRFGIIDLNVYVSSHTYIQSKRSCLIPNAVEDLNLSKRENLAQIHEEVDCLVVGRLSKEKSIDTAVRAFAMLPDRRLTIVGVGPEYGSLRLLIRELKLESSITFLGQKSNIEARALMSAANCIITPSKSEAGPIVLVEAVLSGKPVVASDITAHLNSVAGKSVTFFRVGDPNSLAEAIINPTHLDHLARVQYIAETRDYYSESRIEKLWFDAIKGAPQ